MTRNEFVRICGILGVGLPFQSVLSSCKNDDTSITPPESVLIIGAGAAGLSSGYLLNQRGINYQILEAAPTYGGRIKRTKDFVDFPIPLGGEWIHVNTDIFAQIVNDPTIEVDVESVGYQSTDTYGIWEDGELELTQIGSWLDRKFVNSSWLDFFDEYIVPSVASQIQYNTIVESIDYSRDQVIVTNQGGDTFSAEKVIVTAPLKTLQDGDIMFTPDLPSGKVSAINNAKVWEGIKVFIEFSEAFYPAATEFIITPSTAGQQLYYDASYGQQSERNVLGLFAVGSAATNYISRSDENLIDYILGELDTIFSGQATPNYIKHITQNWSNEPYIKGAYVNDHEDWRRVRTLGDSVANKIYFAGEAYTDGEDWGSVHNAAQAAKVAVQEMAG